jgi:hypothetical protein
MKFKVLLSVALLSAMGSAFAGSNLLTGGSFENPGLSGNTTLDYALGSTAISGWTVVGGPVQLVPDTYLPSASLTASDGHQWVDLTGQTEDFGKGLTSSSITTVIGQIYTLSFDVGTLAGRPNASVAYSINGTSLGTFTNFGANPSGMKWVNNSVTWLATTSSAQITLLGSSANSSSTTLIGLDNVSFTAAVPEPETYALMLAGLGMVGAIARRRKAKQA